MFLHLENSKDKIEIKAIETPSYLLRGFFNLNITQYQSVYFIA